MTDEPSPALTADGASGPIAIELLAPTDAPSGEVLLVINGLLPRPRSARLESLIRTVRGNGMTVALFEGSDDPESVNAVVQDARAVVATLEASGESVTALCGIAEGALVAAGVARRREDLRHIVLIDPISNASVDPEADPARAPDPDDIAFHRIPTLIIATHEETDARAWCDAIERIGRSVQFDHVAGPLGTAEEAVDAALVARAAGFLGSSIDWTERTAEAEA